MAIFRQDTRQCFNIVQEALGEGSRVRGHFFKPEEIDKGNVHVSVGSGTVNIYLPGKEDGYTGNKGKLTKQNQTPTITLNYDGIREGNINFNGLTINNNGQPLIFNFGGKNKNFLKQMPYVIKTILNEGHFGSDSIFIGRDEADNVGRNDYIEKLTELQQQAGENGETLTAEDALVLAGILSKANYRELNNIIADYRDLQFITRIVNAKDKANLTLITGNSDVLGEIAYKGPEAIETYAGALGLYGFKETEAYRRLQESRQRRGEESRRRNMQLRKQAQNLSKTEEEIEKIEETKQKQTKTLIPA